MYRIYKRTKLGWNFSIKKVKYIKNCFFLCGHLEMKNQWKRKKMTRFMLKFT
ncbi:hypothetical protein bcgnr5388_29420 [Bacillus cereus]